MVLVMLDAVELSVEAAEQGHAAGFSGFASALLVRIDSMVLQDRVHLSMDRPSGVLQAQRVLVELPRIW